MSDDVRARREAEAAFRREIKAAIATARAAGVHPDEIASPLRSLAHEVVAEWKKELERRNAAFVAEQMERK
jgi:hypothetical protein